jgi:hypothetical protein
MWSSTWVTTSSTYVIGDMPYQPQRYAFVAFDTAINTAISSVSNISLQLWFTSSNMEGNDGVGVRVYYVGGSTNGNGAGQARENSTSWIQGTSTSQNRVWTNPSTGQYITGSPSKMDALLEFWADNRGDSENWVNFRLHGNYDGMGDFICAQDAQWGEAHAPKLAFNYNLSNVLISGWIKEDENPIQDVTIDLYQSGERVNGSSSSSSGYYSFWVDNSLLQHQLWAWHEDYKPECTNIIPDTSQEENFTLTLESAPTPTPPDSCKDPTGFSDTYNGWTSETDAYTKSGDYAVGNQSNPAHTVYYKNFNWNLPSGLIAEHIKVYIHWKSMIDDQIRVRIHWNESGGFSEWRTFEDQSSWTLDVTVFNDIGPGVTNEHFMVEIEEITQNACDLVLVDWVGTFIEYADVRATTCSISDGSKGQYQSGQIQFHNYGSIPASNFTFRIKINSFDYTDYDTWVNETWSGTSLNAGSSTWRTFSIPCFFEGTTDPQGTTWKGWFALNCGDYEITEVYTKGVTGNDWGSVISQPSNGEFSVTMQSGTHHVFVAHLVDQNFQGNFTANSFFDDLEDTSFNLSGESQTLNSYFDIDFSSLVLSWTPGDTRICELWKNIPIDGKNALGLTVNWNEKTQGTNSSHHGFDLLFGHSWEINTCTFHDPCGAGRANRPGSAGVVMAGYIIDPQIPPKLINCSLITLHEFLHTFGCYPSIDGHCPISGYIMHKDDGDFNMHSNTVDTLLENIDQYDGF